MAYTTDGTNRKRHSSHWGAFNAIVDGGKLVGVEPFERDPNPSPIIDSMPATLYSNMRISRPAVRQSWLEHGPGAATEARGQEPFIEVEWDEALDLVSAELDRVKSRYGNDAIFGGSYGWSSAGRFHHAKTQLHRFLGSFGGFTDQIHSYSNAAGHAILPYIFGMKGLGRGPFTSWDSIAEYCDLFVAFGGLGLKNTQVEPGGMGEHGTHKWLPRLRERGVDVVSITPIKDDSADFLGAQWIAPRPGTDVAMMLGIAHTIVSEGRHDQAFLDEYCVGFEAFRSYLMGETDGVPKDAAWAAAISEVDAQTLSTLARRMSEGTTMIGTAYALQRAEHGEQAYWMTSTLAAILGQIGAPGGGCGFGYGSMNGYGNPVDRFQIPALKGLGNPTNSVIPVARIADMLLGPGEPYSFDGKDCIYPDVHLVYWCGGNPFHHHQDLNRLLKAWHKPDTIVVNEIWWNATAKLADIVLPATTTMERNDIGASSRDRFIMAMQQAVPPVGEARHDFDIFAGLADRLGFRERFTEGRDEETWLRHMYDVSRQQAAQEQIELPDFDSFWRSGYVEIAPPKAHFVQFGAFREDPQANALKTPSGKVEIFSETISSFDYADCPGHPMWMEPQEWLGGERAKQFPLHLISNQPEGKLHAQMDDGPTSKATKINGREPLLMHPDDAGSRVLDCGDLVRVFNDRGAALASVLLSQNIRSGVVRLATGSWFDPVEFGKPGSLEKHGNPNVLTRDRGTSSLAQGPISHSALVEVQRFEGEPPPVTAFVPPVFKRREPLA